MCFRWGGSLPAVQKQKLPRALCVGAQRELWVYKDDGPSLAGGGVLWITQFPFSLTTSFFPVMKDKHSTVLYF